MRHEARRTPLYDLHRELGAKMVPFAGWDMPVQYPKGILQEHLWCRAHAGLPDSASAEEAIGHDKVRAAIAQGLGKLKAQSPNSSGHATRALLLAEPASVDGGEITDKGYINQRAVLTRRTAAVAILNDDASRAWISCVT